MNRGAGYLFTDGEKVLLLKRSKTDPCSPGTWCLPGGGSDEGETPEQTAKRELEEETGVSPVPGKKVETITSTVEGFEFTCIINQVDKFFSVELSHEHSDFDWVEINDPKVKLFEPLKKEMPKYIQVIDKKIKKTLKEFLEGFQSNL